MNQESMVLYFLKMLLALVSFIFTSLLISNNLINNHLNLKNLLVKYKNNKHIPIKSLCGYDLEAMIRAFQALCPGSIPGVRIFFIIRRGSQAWPTAQDLRSENQDEGFDETSCLEGVRGFKSLPLHSYGSNRRKTTIFVTLVFLWVKKEI